MNRVTSLRCTVLPAVLTAHDQDICSQRFLLLFLPLFPFLFFMTFVIIAKAMHPTSITPEIMKSGIGSDVPVAGFSAVSIYSMIFTFLYVRRSLTVPALEHYHYKRNDNSDYNNAGNYTNYYQ